MSKNSPTVIHAPPGLFAIFTEVNEQGTVELYEVPVLVIHAYYGEGSEGSTPRDLLRLHAQTVDPTDGTFYCPDHQEDFVCYTMTGVKRDRATAGIDPELIEKVFREATARHNLRKAEANEQHQRAKLEP